MCARFSLTSPLESVRKLFGFSELPNMGARYNIAPTQNIWAVKKSDREQNTELFQARWGLIPSWAKSADSAARLINARSETVSEKPSFRSAYKSRRCLIPANSFFEWQKIGKSGKQPWRLGLENWELLGFAGLWEQWGTPENEKLVTCTILTTPANPEMSFIHPRMPVIIDPGNFDNWLSGQSGSHLYDPFPAGKMTWYKVDKKVGNVRNEGPELIEEMPETFSLFSNL